MMQRKVEELERENEALKQQAAFFARQHELVCFMISFKDF